MGPDEAANRAQFPGAEAMAAGKLKRLEPELAGLVLPFHMNVRRLAAVEAGEEEPIRPGNTSDSRHLAGISHKGVVDLRSHPNRGRVEAPFCGNRKNRGQLGPVEEDLVGLPARQRG
jgi:hypothetical protein